MRRRDFLALLGAATACPPRAHARDWPARVVRIICPLAAGGGIDATSRIVGARLAEIWSQQVVVENKTGASGNIAAELVAHAEPDGYTIYMATFPHATNRFLYASLSYDPVADFTPIILIGLYPLMMVVPNSSPAHSVAEFIAYAKTRKLSYASSGHGTSLHLAAELFKRAAGIDMTHIPYRGAGPAFTDLIPGRVDAMINFVSSSLPLVQSGRLRGLAVATATRLEVAPDLPTMAEAGVPGVEVSSWAGLLGPAKTPADIVAKLNGAVREALTTSEVKVGLAKLSFEVAGNTPEEFTRLIRTSTERWGPIVQASGFTPDD